MAEQKPLTEKEKFWQLQSFAFVGHSEKRGFPKTSFGTLLKKGGKAFAVDPSVAEIKGQKTYPDFQSLPEKVEGAILELPKEETADWVGKASEAGIKNVWIHMGTETPEAVELAQEKGLTVHTGTCAVMYLKTGFPFHALHRWINKRKGIY